MTKTKKIETADEYSCVDGEGWEVYDSDGYRINWVSKTDVHGKLEMLKDKLNELIDAVNEQSK